MPLRIIAALLAATSIAASGVASAQGAAPQDQSSMQAAQAPDAAAGSPDGGRTRDGPPLTSEMIHELYEKYGSPEELRQLGRGLGEQQRAREESSSLLAMPQNRGINIAFTPAAATNIIQTAKGYPTALSFFDNTGAPWPVAWDTNSNAANASAGTNCSSPSPGGTAPGGPSVTATGFQVCVPVKGSNVLTITPLSISPRGGLLVSLQGAPKPLSFLLVPSTAHYDADTSIRVAYRGPNAKIRLDTRPNAPVTGAPYMTAMLSGIAPADAVPQSVAGVPPDEVRAWRLGNEIYLRTQHTLMSPSWDASEAGEAGVTLYALPATPYVLLSVNNRTVSASLKDQ